MSRQLFLFIGRAGAGKSSIEYLAKKHLNFNRLITFTTRMPRDGEVNGVDYYFSSPEKFKDLPIVASFVARKDLSYGVTNESLSNINGKVFANVISLSYGVKIINAANNVGVKTNIIFLDVDRNTRLNRMISRGESEDSIKKRFEIEDKEGEINLSSIKESFPNSKIITLNANLDLDTVFNELKGKLKEV